jgi:toxin ParE1/3/4
LPELKFFPEARQDLTRIWFIVADHSERSADHVVDDIEVSMTRLVDFPEIGAPRDNLLGGCRLLVVRRYLVLYRYEQPLDEVHILRILEGERDITELF